MPRAHEIAAVVLNPPPSGPVVHNASESPMRDQEYDEILGNTLPWLESIPFNFDEITQTTTGRVFESEDDVRLFFEPAVIIACWPIILAMAPTVANRNYDLALRSERTLRNKSCPDISILKLLRGENDTFVYNPISVVMFKAPGVFSQVCNSGNIDVNAGDDWDIVSSQIRKYAICNQIQNVVVVDDQWGIFVHFSDPDDISAVCNYMVAPVGAGTSNSPITLRELFLFSVFKDFLVEAQIRYAIRAHNLNYIGVTVSASVLDYIEQFPGATPRANSSTITSSTCTGSGTTHVVLRDTQNPLFPLCAITKFDIARSNITGMTEDSVKRNVRPFFVSSNIIPSLEMEIEEHNGKIMISPRSDSRRPSATSDLVLKHFPATDLIGVFQETTVYAALKPYQGLMIPFCYGIFDIDDIDEIGILLENVHGLTLAEYLAGSTMETAQIHSLYLDCFNALHRVHSSGYAHRDIRAENIIISAGQIVLLDFENSKPANESSMRLDKAALRMIFRRFGVDEGVLRGWAT
ncbi:hypothetical protein Q9L58_000527 [Maublancomyces gigas]|uniref:Protein kinase domain-containing protein n=1 Tax=Discina gigas TaxID=1032678 RepID=A0ABR3GWD1_9PEZI